MGIIEETYAKVTELQNGVNHDMKESISFSCEFPLLFAL
jgi:hypothetical protein